MKQLHTEIRKPVMNLTFGAQSEVSEDTLDGEDAICPSRV
ncbi:hypothetical protein T4B_10787 [Trichinella pseudospiralis]|uniref:Uncharacterized protein n=1 Tax=Trichinella pseudospiralis TaxID=6337 RepID=A0A0V1GXG2_TRIPS|nr:hypothetical protein T4B_10787 [Trichinella pseudospiralis]KRZ02666.1 hypothetical protein T4C_10393 [Trichinella pseudospiralis]